ncbi:MAG: hypothetical protein ACHQFW_05805 [Chitinophagales bacterium]
MKIYFVLIVTAILLTVSVGCKQNKTGTTDEIITSADSNSITVPVEDPEPIDKTVVTPDVAAPDKTSVKTSPQTEPGETEMLHGTMMIKGGSWIIRSGDGGDEKDYYPTNLTEEYKIEGLTVGFKGKLQDIPKNVRMVGAPIELTLIKKMTIKN